MILDLAAERKRHIFSDKVFAIVPVYVTSICSQHCLYCNYRADNRGLDVERIRLSDDELLAEAQYLIKNKGFRVLELVYATDPMIRVDTICHHIEMVARLLDQFGGGTVGINAEAFDEHEYRLLLNAGACFSVLWQETYDRQRYEFLHPGGTTKSDFDYRVDAYERMICAGFTNIGMGVLSGLSDWRTDWAMLMQHEAYLQRRYNMFPTILGIPRLKPAAGALLQTTTFIPTREEFQILVALHDLFSPWTMPFVNTREDWQLCVDLSRGGGCLFTFDCCTIPGGYSLGCRGYQFPTQSYDVADYATRLRQQGTYPIFDWSFQSMAQDYQQPSSKEKECRPKGLWHCG